MSAWIRNLVGSTALVALMPVAALAQSAEPASDSDIVVTAQKRDERLIDTPQSVTAISAESLSRMNAVQFRDFANSVPALTFTTEGAGKTQMTLRGVTAGNDIGPTVGVYVDEVPYGSSSAFSNANFLALDAGLFDMSRIEVLRGPQGTLYGASTMGGLIKYVTAVPDTSKFGGSAQFGLSDTHSGGISYNGAAALNAPIVTDKVALRASGFYSHDGGYIDNLARGEKDVNASRIYGGRADLLLQPTEALSVRLTGFLQNIHRDGTASADYSMTGEPIDGSLDQRRPLGDPFEQRFRLASGTIDYDFGPVTLSSISSYQTATTDFRQDVSAFYVPALAPALAPAGLILDAVAVDQVRKVKKFTQEVRLASRSGGTIEWLVGGFYTHEKSGNTQLVVPYDPDGAILPVDLATVSIPSIYKEVAAFGNLTWHITDRFDVSGGLRYSENRQRFEQIGSGLLGVGSGPVTRSKDNVTTYLANARYRFSDRATAYVRYATGYRPGGPNFLVLDPVTGLPLLAPTFASDSLESYEAGFRAETGDRSFAVDLSGYLINWKDIQVNTAAGVTTGIGNAGNARVTGSELTLTARPSRSFVATGAFAYQHARVTEDTPDLGAVKGDRLPNVPKFTATFNIDYRSPEATGLRPTAGATLRFVSDRPSSFDGNFNFPQYRLPDYTAVDLRAGVSFGPVETHLFVRNLFDKRGQLSAVTQLSALGGPAQIAILQPRTIGISATSRF